MQAAKPAVEEGPGGHGAMSTGREYRIDELAREAGTTVRNVRAYQDRGLLPAPRRQGRVGLYGEAHLARLRLVGSLLERGYTLANIAELLAAWERGQDVGALLGFEAALGAPWSAEPAPSVTRADLARVMGDATAAAGWDDRALARAVRVGLLEPDGERYRLVNPPAAEVGALLLAAGVPLPALLDAAEQLQEDVDDLARQFVELVDAQVFEPLGDPPPAADLPRLAALVARLRPLAGQVVAAGVARAMERHVRARFGDHLARFAGASGQEGVDEAS